jgi:L-ascorbate metabolism protein UlaG (beta-lactamase superfamily)
MKQVITWYGHGTWYMETPGGTKIFLDPFIKGNPACPFNFDDINEADIVCVTHGHNDHLGDAYWRVGRKLEAQFQWNHARDLGPDPDDLPKILDKIKNGLNDSAIANASSKSGG